jgi:hypothetical protein
LVLRATVLTRAARRHQRLSERAQQWIRESGI